ncbi:hypothetical protein TrRE_jg7605 [Triparma retinervis]|uniref:Uncharacterized protein n=1 Tax=Triparma retinervis TaxID=2557542 RepID=A0A9W7C8Y5_9STRA|nr:hypothetical protein TrRE_jg7605 [Triparma retinervis]
MIEVVNDNGMNRRTGMYQDLLYLMENSANPHGYDRKGLRHYRFGVIEGVGGQETGDTNIARDYDKSLVPRLIESDVESEPIKEIIDNLLELDILLVPVSQIRPQDGSVTMQIWRPEFKTEEEVMKDAVEYINNIDLTKYSPEKLEAANRKEEESLMEQAELETSATFD